MIVATSEFGIVVRKKALVERNIQYAALVSYTNLGLPLDEDDDLISFGPCFGQEALDELIARLQEFGLIYYDDFFEFLGTYPE